MSVVSELTKVAQDRNRGASQLLDWSLKILIQAYSEGVERQEIGHQIFHLYQQKPIMAPFLHLVGFYLKTLSESQAYCTEVLKNFHSTIQEERKKVLKQAEDLVEEWKSVATFSASSLVMNFFSRIATRGARFRVVVGESLPGGEGVLLARFLSQLGYEVELAPDSSFFTLVQDVDALLLGVDAFSKTFYLHKVGSYPAVLVARLHDHPVYVFAGREKWVHNKWEGVIVTAYDLVRKREREMKTEWTYLTPTYDLIPARFCKYITSSGVKTLEEVVSMWKDKAYPWEDVGVEKILEFIQEEGRVRR